MIRNSPARDVAWSNQTINDVTTSRVVVARQRLETKNLLAVTDAAFELTANGRSVLGIEPADPNTLVISTNVRVAAGKRLSVGTLVAEDLQLQGTANIDDGQFRTLTTEQLQVTGTMEAQAVAIETLDANIANANVLTAETLTVTAGGSVLLDSVVAVSPLYLVSPDNANFRWRFQINALDGNLEFQSAPNWAVRLSVPFGP